MQKSKGAVPLKEMLLRPLLLFLLMVWVTLGFLIYFPLRKTLDSKTQIGIENELSQRMLTLNERLDEMVACLNSVSSITMKNGWSYLNNKSYWERAESKEKIQLVMDTQLQWRNNECLLLDLDAERFLMGTTYLNTESTKALLEQMEQISNNSGFVLYQPIVWGSEGQHYLMMSFQCQVGSVGNQRKLMVLVISSVSIEKMLATTEQSALGATVLSGKNYLADENGELLKTQGESVEQTIRFMTDVNSYGIRIVQEILREEYYREIRQLLVQMTGMILLTVVLGLMLITLIVCRIQQPISGISNVIQNIQLGIPLHREVLKETGIKEYDQILFHIQQADERIRNEKDVLLRVEKEKRAKDVMLLRMQINPHFLYNALNAVQWMARCNNVQEIESYMSALLYILHYNLDEYGKHLVPLEMELTLIEKYVQLHQHRYKNEIDYSIHGNPKLPVLIPRFILQPLVENSIYHGLQNKDGRIELKIEEENNRLCLSVYDNGHGIKPEVLEKISSASNYGMGIGIRYVSAIVSDYGGELAIRNIMEGERICGTEAKITLDIIRAAESGADGSPDC